MLCLRFTSTSELYSSFYSKEHEPVHVHAKYAGRESKAEFTIKDRQIVKITIKKVSGKLPLIGSEKKEFEKFVNAYGQQIVQKWVDFFVYGANVEMEEINKIV